MSNQAQRKNEISVLNVLFCLVVMFIHCSGGTMMITAYKSLKYFAVFTPWCLSSFVVQGFILLSGVKLFLHSSDIRYGDFMKGRLKRVYLPYLVWVIIYYACYCIFGFRSFNLWDLARGILTGDLVGHFYFVIIIMQFYLLLPLWKKLIKRDNIGIILPAALIITLIWEKEVPAVMQNILPKWLFMYNDRIFTTYAVYWIMGCYIGLYYDKFKAMLLNNKAVITVLFVLSAMLDWYREFANQSGLYEWFFIRGIHVLYCICAIIFAYMAVLSLKSLDFAKRRLFQSIDAATYTVYLCHCLILLAAESIIKAYGIQSVTLGLFIKLAMVYPISLAIGLCVHYVKSKRKLKKTNTPHYVT